MFNLDFKYYLQCMFFFIFHDYFYFGKSPRFARFLLKTYLHGWWSSILCYLSIFSLWLLKIVVKNFFWRFKFVCYYVHYHCKEFVWEKYDFLTAIKGKFQKFKVALKGGDIGLFITFLKFKLVCSLSWESKRFNQ